MTDPLWEKVPSAVAPKLAERAAAVLAGDVPVSPARPSASVVMVRDAPAAAGVQVWMMRRVSSMAFAAGAWAFPGGAVDPVDSESVGEVAGAAAGEVVAPGEVLTRCALRELAEEAAVHPDPATLQPWAHWITPEFQPIRYDTWFFLVDGNGLDPRNASTEADRVEWVHPAALLDDPASVLFAPTRVMLLELSTLTSVAAIADLPPRQLEPGVLPRVDLSGQSPHMVIEHASAERLPDPDPNSNPNSDLDQDQDSAPGHTRQERQ